MKNFEIMAAARYFARGRLRRGLRIDLLAGDRAQEAGDDDAVVRLDALLDHPQRAFERADLDVALLDHVVLVDDEQIAPALVGAERGVGHQQRVAPCSPGGTRTRTK